MYVLHYAPDNASLIVRLALEEARAPYRTELVDRMAKAQRSPAYLALNPAGLIPALETPDGVMSETAAILLYLSERHAGLFPPPGDPARAQALRWLIYVANTLHPALRVLFYPEKYVEGDTGPLLAKTKRNVSAHLSLLETNLGNAPFLTRAYICCCLRWCALYGPEDRAWFRLSDTPHLQGIAAELEARPCTQAAQEAEGLGATPFTAPHYPNPPEGVAL